MLFLPYIGAGMRVGDAPGASGGDGEGFRGRWRGKIVLFFPLRGLRRWRAWGASLRGALRRTRGSGREWLAGRSRIGGKGPRRVAVSRGGGGAGRSKRPRG